MWHKHPFWPFLDQTLCEDSGVLLGGPLNRLSGVKRKRVFWELLSVNSQNFVDKAEDLNKRKKELHSLIWSSASCQNCLCILSGTLLSFKNRDGVKLQCHDQPKKKRSTDSLTFWICACFWRLIKLLFPAEHITVPSEQSLPLHPGLQVHVKLLTPSTHVPPGAHGELKQSSTSAKKEEQDQRMTRRVCKQTTDNLTRQLTLATQCVCVDLCLFFGLIKFLFPQNILQYLESKACLSTRDCRNMWNCWDHPHTCHPLRTASSSTRPRLPRRRNRIKERVEESKGAHWSSGNRILLFNQRN